MRKRERERETGGGREEGRGGQRKGRRGGEEERGRGRGSEGGRERKRKREVKTPDKPKLQCFFCSYFPSSEDDFSCPTITGDYLWKTLNSSKAGY